jgi:glutathione S-transferase
MKLYGFPGSPNTWKVRAFAEQIGAPLDFVVVDLSKGAQRQADYLALNPLGRTPTLVDGDFVLWESTAIMQYLGDSAKTDLWPQRPRTRADISRWQSWGLQHFGPFATMPMAYERIAKKIYGRGDPDPQVVAKAEAAFRIEAGMLDAHLAKHSHLVEDRLTLADFSIIANLVYWAPAGMPLTEFVHAKRWFDAISSLPAWTKTAPQSRP